jgi:hypothetical protein
MSTSVYGMEKGGLREREREKERRERRANCGSGCSFAPRFYNVRVVPVIITIPQTQQELRTIAS